MKDLKNTFWLLFSKFSGLVISLGSTYLIARSLGGMGYGVFAYLGSVFSVFSILSTFGLDIVQTRRVASSTASIINLGPVATAQLTLSAILYLLAFLLPTLGLIPSDKFGNLSLYLLLLFPTACISALWASLKGQSKMNVFSAMTTLDGLLQLVGILLFLSKSPTVEQLIWILLISKMAALAVSVVYFRFAAIPVSFSIREPGVFRILLKSGGWISVGVILTTILQRSAILFLEQFTSDSELGYFAFANRLLDILKFLSAAYYGALFPMLVSNVHEREKKLPNPTLFILITLSGAFIFSLMAEKLIESILPEFISAVPVFLILLSGLLPFLIKQYFAVKLLALGKEREVAISAILTFFIAIPLYYYGASTYRSVGLAWCINIGLVAELAVLLVVSKLTLRYSATETPNSELANRESHTMGPTLDP